MVELDARPLGEFRGAVETGRYRWLAWEGDAPVGYIDCGTYDRWTIWDGGPNGGGVVSSIAIASAAIAYVIDPAQRRRGAGSTMIKALTVQPELAHVHLFAAGIEPENVASVRVLTRAGFHPMDPEPDFEGIVYFGWWRDS
jgi:RimJ/RimL family protein N-acetyltransferase